LTTVATKPDVLHELVHYSRLLGADESLVLRGGGNTSVKTTSPDLMGRPTATLLVKGSGSDLATARSADFAALRLDDLLWLRDHADLSDEEMVEYLVRCKLDPNAPRPSIETLLHAFLPARSVFHSHADAILSLINSPDPEGTVRSALGTEVACVPYRRPGFLLSREVADEAERPGVHAVVLLNHGLVTWGESPEQAHRAHVEMVARGADYVRQLPEEGKRGSGGIARELPEEGKRGSDRDARQVAEAQKRGSAGVFLPDAALVLDADQRRAAALRLAPVLRGALSGEKRVLLCFDDRPEILDFVGSARARAASAAGAATPDHILTTKHLPLWIDALPAETTDSVRVAVNAALEDYRAAYQRYVSRWRTTEPELEANPRIVLVPGVGLFAAGAQLRAARLARDIYVHTIAIMAGAERLGGYRSLPEAEAFRAEYWPLELYKLTLAAAERELARRVVLVTGAGSGLGRAIALQLARAGAHIVVTDLDAQSAARTAREISEQHANAGVLTRALDVTREADIAAAFEHAVLEFGGLDVVVSNAGHAHCAPIESLQLADWERSLAVNATGHFLVVRDALRHFRAQGIGGSVVCVATKNVVAPGADFAAYSAAKAAEAQLARVAAIEGGPLGVRVNMVNPDAIFAGTHLWDDIRKERARAHGIPPEDIEAFYRKRSLLGVEVRAEDVAEAVLFLASDRSSRTTGCMIPVDGGVREAFVR
jgi:rhamnulose-1-phosphate aldolase/alcohol dehydrogenase